MAELSSIGNSANQLSNLGQGAVGSNLAGLTGSNPVPKFKPGTVIECPSLVIDENGVAWWVNPQNVLIRRAEPR